MDTAGRPLKGHNGVLGLCTGCGFCCRSSFTAWVSAFLHLVWTRDRVSSSRPGLAEMGVPWIVAEYRFAYRSASMAKGSYHQRDAPRFCPIPRPMYHAPDGALSLEGESNTRQLATLEAELTTQIATRKLSCSK